jgi:hypothetical protein
LYEGAAGEDKNGRRARNRAIEDILQSATVGYVGRKRVVLIISGAAVATLVVAAANWRLIGLSAALLFAEKRPTLLQDAMWDDEVSSKKFQQRFRRGVPERDLNSWLKTNKFEIDAQGVATKPVRSLPCNELVRVTWSSSPDHRLVQATARVSESGCL